MMMSSIPFFCAGELQPPPGGPGERDAPAADARLLRAQEDRRRRGDGEEVRASGKRKQEAPHRQKNTYTIHG